MVRFRNSGKDGRAWSEQIKLSVWNRTVGQYEVGTDKYGHKIKFSEHGNTNSNFGWEIDHIKPVSKGGTDDLSNLQALYWMTNRDKGDKYPY